MGAISFQSMAKVGKMCHMVTTTGSPLSSITASFTMVGKSSVSVDDDMWVFINGTLALDLGGVHTELAEKVELDHLGLTTGEPVSLDVFYAERHTVGAHFRIETTIRLDQAVNEDLWLTIAKWPVQRLLLL